VLLFIYVIIFQQPKLTESCGYIQSDYVKKAQSQLIKINHGEDYMGLFKNYDDCQVK